MAFLNESGLTRLWEHICAKLATKVTKVEGKDLSSNDYTTAEKEKLSGISANANNYSLPTASSSTLGGVKTGSNITNSSGTISLTKANVTNALGYTPPTENTTYTLNSFGVTATSGELNKLDGVTASTDELNYVDGVTSNIQTQLDSKADLDHTHAGTGEYSVSIGEATTVTGNQSTSVGQGSAVSNVNVAAFGQGVTVSGDNATAVGQASIASGGNTVSVGQSSEASGNYSIAIGQTSKATGDYSISIGQSTTSPTNSTVIGQYASSGVSSVVVGQGASAAKDYSVIVGQGATATGDCAVVVGQAANASGVKAVAIGHGAVAEGNYSVVLGSSAHATGEYAVAEGFNTYATGNGSHAEGWNTEASGFSAHAEGSNVTASGFSSHAEGVSSHRAENITTSTNVIDIEMAWETDKFSLANGEGSHVEGKDCISLENYSHAEGYMTKTGGASAHAEGQSTTANGNASHAEGGDTKAFGEYSHAEGYKTKTDNISAHAEGNETLASGENSHAEGLRTMASGTEAHAEGFNTRATAPDSHAEGWDTRATSLASHSEGYITTASGLYSHSEGQGTIASGTASHAEGLGTTASGDYQHVQGKYNKVDESNKYAHIVGGGTKDEASGLIDYQNIHTLDWEGNALYAGTLGAFGATIHGDATIGGKTKCGENIYFNNNQSIIAQDSSGNERNVIELINTDNNIRIGQGLYDNCDVSTESLRDDATWRTIIRGKDVYIGSKAAGDSFRPYYRKDNVIQDTWRTTGYVTGSSKAIYFIIPLNRPIIGSPTISVSSGADGLILRQSGKYTHGSSSSAPITDATYSASLKGGSLAVVATVTDTTNAINNDVVCIVFDGIITLS